MTLLSPHTSLTLVIDQGSHASRVALFTETGELVYLQSHDISSHTTDTLSNYVTCEQSADDILQSIQTLLNNIPAKLSKNIHCAGLCTQRSTIVAWHKTSGKPLSPAISWRDKRAQALTNKLRPSAKTIRTISGLPLSVHYSAGKIHWILNNNLKAQHAEKQQQLCITPLASYLLFHLLNEKPIVIDHSNAQRTQLFDIHTLNWSKKLLQIFDIEPHILPYCVPVIHLYGHLTLNSIPLTSVVGDQNAVLNAYPSLNKHDALINIGTGAFILSPTSDRQSESPRLLHTLASSDREGARFVIEATVNGAGAALSWAQKHDPCNDLFKQLPIWLTQIDSPPVFINNISGLGSPWWCTAGKPEFISSKKTYQSERYVAIIESIIFLIFHNIQQLKIPPKKIFISGGLSQLDALCQKLADLSQIKILRFTETEASARGCAWLANQTFKNSNLNWKPLTVSQQFKPCDEHHKNIQIIDRYQQFVGELNKLCSTD